MNKHLDNAIFIMMILVLIFAIGCVIVLIYPFKVIEFNDPYKVLTPVVQAGNLMQYRRDSVKYMQLTGDLSCHFEDGLIYAIPSVESNNPVGPLSGVVSIQIPKELPPGTYIYKCTVTYKLAGIRELRYEFQTEAFEVTK